MEWNVREDMVDELRAAGVAGITSKLQAMLVFQHCSVHSMSVFDFVSRFHLDGLRIVPLQPAADSVPSAASSEEWIDGLSLPGPVGAVVQKPDSTGVNPVGVLAATAGVVWKYAFWREEKLAADRLEMLRKHIAEVQESDPQNSWLDHLRGQAAALARVVEPVPTLGLVGDDRPNSENTQCQVEPLSAATGEAEHGDVASGADSKESGKPCCAATAEFESKERIADLLSNPSAVHEDKPAEEVRRDSRGRVLTNAAQLQELIDLGGRLGMARSVVEDSLCKNLKVPKSDQAPRDQVAKVIENMKRKIGVA